MFVTWISFRETFQSFWDLTEVCEQSWYNLKVLIYELVNPTFKILLGCLGVNCAIRKKLAEIFNVECDFTGKMEDQIFENVLLVRFASFIHILMNPPFQGSCKHKTTE